MEEAAARGGTGAGGWLQTSLTPNSELLAS